MRVSSCVVSFCRVSIFFVALRRGTKGVYFKKGCWKGLEVGFIQQSEEDEMALNSPLCVGACWIED